MDIKKYTEEGKLSADELEAISKELIQAKFDREKRKAWGQRLKDEYGVERGIAHKKRSFPFSKLAIAAILACITGIVMYSVILFSTSKYDNLVNESIEKLITIDNHAVVTRGDEAIDAQVLSAIEAYKNQEYEQSIIIWQQLITTGKLKGSTHYNLALCYLQKEPSATEEAIKNLLEARNTKTVQEEANWALALAYLQVNKKEEAKEILQEFIHAKAYKYKKAEALIKLF